MTTIRLRRNRHHPVLRSLVRETPLLASDLIQPFFLLEGKERQEAIETLPGIHRLSADLLIEQAKELCQAGVHALLLFPFIPKEKRDARGSEALNPEGLLPCAIKAIKDALPHMLVIADVALDPYTSHGHDGLVSDGGEILNDPTVEILAEKSCLLAEAGVDMIAPSDMMDLRVKWIRHKLDERGHTNVGIMAYSAKYASAFYGPFRSALDSAPAFGNKATYQLDPANWREALLEAHHDELEGADILMVKPALPYLDVIARLREQTHRPIAAFQVSGEYSMIMAAHEKGWIDGPKALLESTLAIKRAGADMIISYGCRKLVKGLREGLA